MAGCKEKEYKPAAKAEASLGLLLVALDILLQEDAEQRGITYEQALKEFIESLIPKNTIVPLA